MIVIVEALEETKKGLSWALTHIQKAIKQARGEIQEKERRQNWQKEAKKQRKTYFSKGTK